MTDKLEQYHYPNYFSCIGKGGKYYLVSLPVGAGVSKVFDPIVVYSDSRTKGVYWRFLDDFLDRMEVITDGNTEEDIKNKERS